MCFVSLLIERKLHDNFKTWTTNFQKILRAISIVPILVTTENNPSTILTLVSWTWGV